MGLLDYPEMQGSPIKDFNDKMKKDIIDVAARQGSVADYLKIWTDYLKGDLDPSECVPAEELSPEVLETLKQCTITSSELKGELKLVDVIQTDKGVCIVAEDPDSGKKYAFTDCVPTGISGGGVLAQSCEEKIIGPIVSQNLPSPNVDKMKGLLHWDGPKPGFSIQ